MHGTGHSPAHRQAGLDPYGYQQQGPQTEQFCSSSFPQQFSSSCAPVTGHTEASTRAVRRAWGPCCPVLSPVPMGMAPGAPGRGMDGMVALEGMCGWECRRQLGCCSLALPSPLCHGPHARASSCPLKPMTFLTPYLVFHLVFILFPLSGLSCPGNDSPVSSASHYTPVIPSSPWLRAPLIL